MTGGCGSVGREQGADEEIEGVRGERGACCCWWGWSCAEGELGVSEQGKEGAQGCGQTEGEADVEATTGIVFPPPSSLNVIQSILSTKVFMSQSGEFQEAIASILGLKLAFYSNGQVRVTSVNDLLGRVWVPGICPASLPKPGQILGHTIFATLLPTPRSTNRTPFKPSTIQPQRLMSKSLSKSFDKLKVLCSLPC
jgi:hypothetical protein